MPRKKAKGYGYRGDRSTIERVRTKFQNEYAMLMLETENWHEMLATGEERQAFAELFPEQTLEAWGFIRHDSDHWPASTEFEYRDTFKRDEGFYKGRFPGLAFDPPSLAGVAFREHCRATALARGEWFRANKIRMTAAERAWLEAGGPATTEESDVLEMGKREHGNIAQ